MVAITTLTVSMIALSNVVAGPLSNVLDIAPNFAGTVLGICTTTASFMGWISTQVLSLFLKNNENFDGWAKYYWVASGLCLFAGVIFIIFTSSHIPSWNFDNNQSKDEDEVEEQERLSCEV